MHENVIARHINQTEDFGVEKEVKIRHIVWESNNYYKFNLANLRSDHSIIQCNYFM